jgi:hypothetical protein
MGSLSPVVVRFAAAYLASPEELHVLALCVEQRERWFDAHAVATALGITRRAARGALDRLACSNLLDIRVTGEVRYRFRPGTSDLEAQAEAFVAKYRRNPLEILELIGPKYSRSSN